MRSLLKNRNFLLLWGGQTVSALGTWINFVGLNLYVLDVFGSGRILGSFLVVRMLPAIFFGPLGGYLADKFSRRTIMITCDIARAVLVLGFLLTRNLWVFMFLGMALSSIDKVFQATQRSFLPNVVPKEGLVEANAAWRMSTSLTTVIGPAVGGFLVSVYSYPVVFVVDALTFVFSVICTLLITVTGQVKKAKKGSAAHEFGLVVTFFKTRVALLFLTIARLIDALGSGAYNTSLPLFSKVLAKELGGVYGWLIGAWAFGQFLGAYIVTKLLKKLADHKEAFFTIVVVLMALGMGGTFHCSTLAFAMLAIFVGGFGDGMSNVLFNTVLMAEAPDETRGKIFGTLTALIYTAVALGMAGTGFFLDFFNMRAVTNGATAIIITGVVLGSLAHMRRDK